MGLVSFCSDLNSLEMPAPPPSLQILFGAFLVLSEEVRGLPFFSADPPKGIKVLSVALSGPCLR